MGNSYYFISDVHLGMVNFKYAKEQENLLLSFFNRLIEIKPEELFIVGDFFDSWIEYRQVVPKGHYRILSKIYDLVESGIKITYLSGNHDFWRGHYFKDEFNIDILDHPIELNLEGKRFFIHHGDGLAYNDTGYKILKKILRSKISQFLYSWIHPDIGLALAKKTSYKSRDYTSEKDYSEKDGLKDAAIKKIDEGFNYVIMGHRHKPVMEIHNQGCYINLGDWIKSFSYGVFDNGKFFLKQYYDFKERKFVDIIISEF